MTRLGRFTPAQQVDIEISLLEQRLKGAEGQERADIESQIRALKAFERRQFGGPMSNIEQKYRAALNALASEVVVPGEMLARLDADREKYPPNWYQGERLRLIRAAQGGDQAARIRLAEYAEAGRREAAKLRAQAEADRDPAVRTAEIAERQALIAANASASDLLADAYRMLDAERPERAAFLLAVARERGAMVTDDLPQQVEAALDADNPTRQQARDIEAAVEANLAQYAVLRARTLVASGLGMTESGDAGTGAPGDVARANVTRKLAAYATGEDHSDAAVGTAA